MEKKIKDVIGTDPEDLLDSITSDFTELIKYEALFTHENFRKSYLEDVNRLYASLIGNCRFFLADLYKKEIENIFSEEVKTLPKINEETINIIKIVNIEKTLIPEGKKTENL